ncbi:MAG: PLP-dependent aminotransferase family protein [Chitinophaga sp.]|uniref:MocR-like pyridoxine biosynthesis transcription factor PdxR n=1 Tax=Chitinophaga sp. TaxID=1869181 RepID=UPI0025C06AE2|nr:PLP-dependent aminotransferase family protein [Chitinophaga sp.]MBV8256013.1 PLP-dependent aminotransferase family protein [Chitinophaga sp.]
MLRPWKLQMKLEPHSGKAIYLQIADAIIEDIKSGRLKAGAALPGSRVLAAALELNRNTVVEALQVLLHEEWVVSVERKGIFVAAQLPNAGRPAKPRLPKSDPPTPEKSVHIVFDDGHPDSKIAPVNALARAYRQLFNQKAKWKMMGYANELGDPAFRKAIAHMLNHQRGMQLDEHQICITRGSQMAMYLAAQCLIREGDEVVVEHPGYMPAWRALEHAGAKLLHVPVDQDGIRVDKIAQYIAAGRKIKAVYITPHHQYPTTVTLSLQRRLELIRLSNKHHFTIMEDDYDNEFHFGYRPILPVSSLEEVKHYMYIGTMSKVVAPALRIGYLVGSAATIEKVGQLRKMIDVQGDTIMEQAVLQLIEDGTIRRHIKKATAYYRSKRDLTAQLLQQHLEGKLQYTIPEGGLAFWLVPIAKIDWELLSVKLLKRGVKIISQEIYGKHPQVNGFRLSYGALSEVQLREGIAALAACL